MTKRFQFRWGIPEWDVGSTDIPNPIFQYYSNVPWVDKNGKAGLGISNTEAMFILHLASFHFESKRGKSKPSLTSTLRERMGYKTNQGIINIMQSLEDKGLIIVNRTPGQCNDYNFRPFSKAVMELWQTDNPSEEVDQSTKIDGESSTKIDGESSTKIDTKKKKKEEEIKKKKSSASGADRKPNGLLPDTQESRMMFGRLQASAKAAGRRGPTTGFRTLEQKRKFDQAAAKLDEHEFERALIVGLEQGINSVDRMTNWVAKWDGNRRQAPPRNDPDKFDRARAMTLERLERHGNQ